MTMMLMTATAATESVAASRKYIRASVILLFGVKCKVGIKTSRKNERKVNKESCITKWCSSEAKPYPSWIVYMCVGWFGSHWFHYFKYKFLEISFLDCKFSITLHFDVPSHSHSLDEATVAFNPARLYVLGALHVGRLFDDGCLYQQSNIFQRK